MKIYKEKKGYEDGKKIWQLKEKQEDGVICSSVL